MADFCAHVHPVLAVPCSVCRAKPGAWCIRPSGHRASDFHDPRKHFADTLFIQQHGADASIERIATGWHIDPTGYRQAREEGRGLALFDHAAEAA